MRFGEIIITSLCKFSSYPKLLKVGNFKTFLYAFFLSLLLLFGVAVTLYPIFKGDDGLLSVLRDELPDFKTEDGELTCENTIVDEDGLYIEVDTSKTGVLDLPDGYDQSMMISKTDIHMLNNGREQQLSFSDLPDFSKDSVINWLDDHSVLIFAAILCFVLSYLVISMAISMLFYALVAFLIDKLAIHSGLFFGAVFKLTVFSMTFATLLKMLFMLLNTVIRIGSLDIISPFITMFYIIKGILSCKAEKDNEGIVIAEL